MIPEFYTLIGKPVGAINLAEFWDVSECFQWERLRRTVADAVEMLDDRVDDMVFSIPEIATDVKDFRRISLSVMGWADLLFKMGMKYGGNMSFNFASSVSCFIYSSALIKSLHLGQKKGAYPACQEHTPLHTRNASFYEPLDCPQELAQLAGCSPGIYPVYDHTTHPEYLKACADIKDQRIGMGVFVSSHEVEPKDFASMQRIFRTGGNHRWTK